MSQANSSGTSVSNRHERNHCKTAGPDRKTARASERPLHKSSPFTCTVHTYTQYAFQVIPLRSGQSKPRFFHKSLRWTIFSSCAEPPFSHEQRASHTLCLTHRMLERRPPLLPNQAIPTFRPTARLPLERRIEHPLHHPHLACLSQTCISVCLFYSFPPPPRPRFLN